MAYGIQANLWKQVQNKLENQVRLPFYIMEMMHLNQIMASIQFKPI